MTHSSAPRSERIGLGLLAAWSLLLVVELTWTPFRFVWAVDTEALFPHTGPVDLVGNVVLFLPFAVFWALLRPREGAAGRDGTAAGARVRAGRVALLVGALSMVVELGQLLSPDRVASVTDVVLNAGGAAGAVLAVDRLRDRIPRRGIAFGVAVPIVAVLAWVALTSAAQYEAEVRIQGWDETYPVVVADEIGDDRRYVGEVSEAYLCAGEGEARVCVEGGADVEARSRLVAEAEASQVVEAGARVVSASDVQTGPTRIVSFSRGQYLRNLTLGQEGTDLVVRVRTPFTGPNGREPELLVHGAIRAGVPARVMAVFRHGTVRVRVETDDGARSATWAFDAFNPVLAVRGREGLPATEAVTRRIFMLLLALPAVALAFLAVPARAGGAARAE